MEEMNILDILLDEENDAPIIMTSEDGVEFVFEQIAVIPQGDVLYCILQPQDYQALGLDEDEALVCRVEEPEEGMPYIVVEEDEAVIDAVFAVYDQLVSEDEQ